MKNWKDTVVGPEATILNAVEVMDKIGLQIAIVVDGDFKLLGVITDGDLRRGILKGYTLDKPAKLIMNPNPRSVSINETKEAILQKMTSLSIQHIPVLDEQGRIVKLEILEELVQVPTKPNDVVLIAGGLGTRLRPLTENFPKPLLKVGSKPILETIIDNFSEYGFRNFHLSVNYKSDLIEEHFGDGSKWGVKIKYVHEDKKMGTAGALGLLSERPKASFFVMNADLLTKVNFQQLLDFHKENGAIATMCVRQYDYQVPYGVVSIDGHKFMSIVEKPVQYFFINAGIYILEPEALDFVPKNEYLDMPTLFDKLTQDGRHTIVFPIREYWLDIGQKNDYDRANDEFQGIFG